MAREHKVAVSLNEPEHFFVSSYSMAAGQSKQDYLRGLVHEDILNREGEEAAVHLLRGSLPAHGQGPHRRGAPPASGHPRDGVG